MTDVAISGDAAIGGAGGAGADGGDGGAADGGGIYVDPSSTVALDAVVVTGNQADGGAGGVADPGGTDGNAGAGIGGGIYLAGSGSTEKSSRISGNTASTSNDDVCGQLGAG